MIGILGSGFGLYGYLPAAASIAKGPILLPARYQEKFSNRLELQRFTNQICWINSDDELIKEVTTLIISKRPKDQFELLEKLLNQRQITNIIFEKPFAQNPMQAMQMQEGIRRSNKKCSVGFIFRHLPWAILQKNELRRQVSLSPRIWELKWQFMAHHYEKDIHNWKRMHDEGGGVIRFYGIHIIALLAEWGYDKVSNSDVFIGPQDGDYLKWQASFSGMGLPVFRVEIDINNTNSLFFIKNDLDGSFLHESRDPFGDSRTMQTNRINDLRCEYIKEVLIENSTQSEIWPDRFSQAIDLWEIVEANTRLIEKKQQNF